MHKKNLFVGIDAGASKTFLRLETESGELLNRIKSGPASIRLSVEGAWQSLEVAIAELLQGFSLEHTDVHVGIGIAGSEIKTAYQKFMLIPHTYKSFKVVSDAHTACLGAHHGQDGAIIIAGTGCVGYALSKGVGRKVGGYGFPHDDAGAGAWIGLQAVSHTCQTLDKRISATSLSANILNFFSDDEDSFVHWINAASSTDFASLFPLIQSAANEGCETAIQIMRKAAESVAEIASILLKNVSLPLCLVGGVAPSLLPYLNSEITGKLREAHYPPDKGAIFMIKDQFQVSCRAE